jgi:hypothetical protein
MVNIQLMSLALETLGLAILMYLWGLDKVNPVKAQSYGKLMVRAGYGYFALTVLTLIAVVLTYAQ